MGSVDSNGITSLKTPPGCKDGDRMPRKAESGLHGQKCKVRHAAAVGKYSGRAALERGKAGRDTFYFAGPVVSKSALGTRIIFEKYVLYVVEWTL